MGKTRTALVVFAIAIAVYFFTPHTPTKVLPLQLYSTDVGDDLRAVYLAAFERAKESIDIVIYSIQDPKVLRTLNRKAAEGVQVTLVFDLKASDEVPKKLRPEIRAIPRNGPGLTHQKIVVIDRKSILLGTANLTSASLGNWGNLVSGIEHVEMAEWLSDHIRSLPRMGVGVPKRATFSSPGVSLAITPDPSGIDEMVSLIRAAEKTMQVAMFTWTHLDLAKEVIAAKDRGVDVEVYLDHNSSQGTSRKVAEAFVDQGVKVYFYDPSRLLHYKTLVVDDKTMVNGSANWTISAFHKNDDCYMVLRDLNPSQIEFLDQMWRGIREKSNENRLVRTGEDGERGGAARRGAGAPNRARKPRHLD